MKKNYQNLPDGYQESIYRGINGVRNFRDGVSFGGPRSQQIDLLKKEIETADAIVVGAGAGLSTAAGFEYGGRKFYRYFSDFADAFGITDMYSGGFYPFPEAEILWAWWARHIYFNRYVKAPKPVYENLLDLVKGRNYFVITTNVDHQFQMAGFDKKRLFYTQGDYGLFQSVNPMINKTYDNEEWVHEAMLSQGFVKDEKGVFDLPKDKNISMRIPTELIPKCPDDGSDVKMNLRADDSFVEDEGWHIASARYYDFLERHKNSHVLFMEIGVGSNTPVIIKYPFWQMTNDNKKAVYACLNYNEAFCPKQIEKRSICINGDTADALNELMALS